MRRLMSQYRQQLLGAVEATRIHSPTRFSWFGEHSPALPAGLKSLLDARAARDHLRSSLALRLYADFYCTGGARPQGNSISVGSPRSAGMQFASLLSTANCSEGRWEEGWVVSAVDQELLSLRRDGLTLQAGKSDPRVRHSGGYSEGARASVRMPKELFNISPGFYMALGNREPARGSPMLRFYFDISPAAAVSLTREITSRLNRDGLAFRLKVLNDVGAFTRCDCMVLYVARDDFSQVRIALEKLHLEFEPQLRGRAPALTLKLAQGIGLAEDPESGQSFGLHRCSLVADGLVQAWDEKASAADDRLAIVAARFAREGIDVDRPYLRPGSDAHYPFNPQRVGHAGADPPQDRFAPQDFLRVAEEIGRNLSAKALWHGDSCNWMGSAPAGTLNPDGRSARVFAALGPDLYLGTSGIALFLASLWAATGGDDRRLERTATGAMRHALDHIEALKPGERLGLYTGRFGIMLACARMAFLLKSGEFLGRAAALLSEPLDLTAADFGFDVMSGRAGAVIALLSLKELGTRRDPLELAARLGDEIIAGAQKRDAGLAWPTHSSAQRRLLTGYSHGAAGIGYSLLELFQQSGETRYADAAMQAFRYERSWFNADKGNWVDLRDNDGDCEHLGRFGYPAQWCHGAPGIALSRVRAHAILRDATCLAEARVALATTQRSVETALEEGGTNYSLCHGIAGNADVLILGAGVLGSSAIAAARKVGSAGISRFARCSGAWPLGACGELPGAMLGLAGIGHFYLRLFDSRIPSFLMWRPEEMLEGSAWPRNGSLASQRDISSAAGSLAS
jgi:hypothetical protein